MTTNSRRRRPSPRGVKLNKRFIATQDDYDFYAVNGYAVRGIAQPEEEFGCSTGFPAEFSSLQHRS